MERRIASHCVATRRDRLKAAVLLSAALFSPMMRGFRGREFYTRILNARVTRPLLLSCFDLASRFVLIERKVAALVPSFTAYFDGRSIESTVMRQLLQLHALVIIHVHECRVEQQLVRNLVNLK